MTHVYEDRCQANAAITIEPDGQDVVTEVRCELAADHLEPHRATIEWER